jgi:hypothetical protein
MEALLEILHQDADLLVVSKPAGLVCHPTKGDAWSSLISRVRLHLGADAQSVSEKYPGRSCGGAGRLASLLLGYRFLANMRPRRASPSAPPRSQSLCRPIFKTRS